jgi:DNA-binding GntR family transcriptional regulator
LSKSNSVRSIDVVSVVDQVTAEIRRSIYSGDLHPGQEFSLRQIAEQLGVSLIPVRESLRRLEFQGLIVTRRAKSAFVAPLDPQEFRDIYRLRLRIEPELVERACVLLTPADFERLDVMQRAHAAARDSDERWEAHVALHSEIIRPAASTWDMRVLETLWHASERYVRYAFGRLEAESREPERRDHAHGELLAVLRTGDPEGSYSAIEAHLRNTEEIVLRALADAPMTAAPRIH